jgi:hypothetical protein
MLGHSPRRFGRPGLAQLFSFVSALDQSGFRQGATVAHGKALTDVSRPPRP